MTRTAATRQRRSGRALETVRAWLPAAAALLLFAGLALRVGAADGWRYQHNIGVGQQFGAPSQLLPGQPRGQGFGYDGEFYFFIAQDPFLRNPATAGSLDNSFRYRRIIYPLLVAALSLGQREWLPLLLVWVNVAAATALVAACSLAARRAGLSPWVALVIALFPGIWVPIVFDLTEPLHLALLAWAMVSESAWLLLLASLAKETSLLVQLSEMARRILRRDFRGAIPSVGLILVFGAWALVVQQVVHAQNVTPTLNYLLDPPAAPVFQLLQNARSEPARNILLLPAVLICVLSVLRLLRVRDRFALGGGAYAAFTLIAGSQTWSEPAGYFRVIAGAAVLVFLSWVTARDRMGLAVVLLMLGTGILTLFLALSS